MALTLDTFNTNAYVASATTLANRDEYHYLVRAVPDENFKKTIKRIFNKPLSTRGGALGDSGETWHIVVAADPNLDSSIESTEAFKVWSSPRLVVKEGIYVESDGSNPMDLGPDVDEFLTRDLAVGHSDSMNSGHILDIKEVFGDSAWRAHPDLSHFFDASGFYRYDDTASEWIAGLIGLEEVDSSSILSMVSSRELLLGENAPSWVTEASSDSAADSA